MKESFEKFLFHAAFIAYERYKFSIDFSVSEVELNAKMEHDKIIPTLDQICIKYGLKKSWISDYVRYIAQGENINFIVKYHSDICGIVTGDDKRRVNLIYQEFVGYFGVG